MKTLKSCSSSRMTSVISGPRQVVERQGLLRALPCIAVRVRKRPLQRLDALMTDFGERVGGVGPHPPGVVREALLERRDRLVLRVTAQRLRRDRKSVV